MLNNLSIKNYALIEDISIDFTKGLSVLTGETGAGKSIIIGAVDLLLGERASSSAIRNGQKICTITASFDISSNKKINSVFEKYGLEQTDELIIRRQLDISGKNKIFINDTPVSLTALTETGKYLIDFYAQHKSNMLFDGNYQLQLVDDIAENKKLLSELNEKYTILSELQNKKENLISSQKDKEIKLDIYNYQLNELKKAALKPDEEQQIQQQLPSLKNAEKIIALSNEISFLLYKRDNSVLDLAEQVAKKTDTLNSLGINTENISKMINGAIAQLNEVYNEVYDIANTVDSDPNALNNLLERQQLIKQLKSKYKKTVDELIAFETELETKIKEITFYDSNLDSIEKEIKSAQKEVEDICLQISNKRKAVSKKLSDDIVKQLKDLNMKNAQFAIDVKHASLSRNGYDKVEFLFNSNLGQQLKPLADVASGGELSRVLLAIAVILSNFYSVGTIIFDEIDTGVSGLTGEKIGKKLKNISKQKQVILISHLAQVVSNADKHIKVYKDIVDNKTVTKVKVLNEQEHIKEIATLISGEKITEYAIKHAKELVK
ncbi:DNA repair protein RecN [Candidatus Ruminimicrobium bovinum]|uniref:DNA repair protein RecN n=1 Tax=Candidatus Ruminimicrobium bovinum TaxID=3242779 RepID=UPI0039B88842